MHTLRKFINAKSILPFLSVTLLHMWLVEELLLLFSLGLYYWYIGVHWFIMQICIFIFGHVYSMALERRSPGTKSVNEGCHSTRDQQNSCVIDTDLWERRELEAKALFIMSVTSQDLSFIWVLIQWDKHCQESNFMPVVNYRCEFYVPSGLRGIGSNVL